MPHHGLCPRADGPVGRRAAVTAVQGHRRGDVSGREGLVGLPLEALGPQVQQGVEGGGGRGGREGAAGGGRQVVGVRGQQGLGRVAVGQRGEREKCDGGGGVQARQGGVVMAAVGQRERERAARWRRAAAEPPRSLE